MNKYGVDNLSARLLKIKLKSYGFKKLGVDNLKWKLKELRDKY